MKRNFSKALPIELRYEGGFSNNRRDPGGVTLEGVIQRVYDGYRDRKGLKRRPLTAAMRGKPDWTAERNEIYRLQYWNAVRGDDLPAGVDLFVFDSAINSGPYRAVLWLQRALRVNECDGHLGEGTLSAVQNHPDHDRLIADMAARRLGMLQHLSTWDAFGKGWTARVSNLKAICQSWATGSVGPQPIEAHEDGGHAKAYASDVSQPFMDAGDAVKTGVGGGVAATAIDGAKDALAPMVGSSEWVTKIFTILTIASVVLTLAALGYSLWSNHKSKKARRAIDGDVLADVPEGQPA